MQNQAHYDLFKKYESQQSSYLSKSAFIIRLDGRAFSNFCLKFEKPYSPKLHAALNKVCLELCKEIQDCKFAQRHSDEMSFLVILNNENDGYFGLNTHKICSVLASIASSVFIKELLKTKCIDIHDEEYPAFDARCFNIKEADIVSYFEWRLSDSYKNSINSWARHFYSHDQLLNKNCKEMIFMMEEKGFNWNQLSSEKKNGYCFFKSEKNITKIVKIKNEDKLVSYIRSVWDVSPTESLSFIKEKLNLQYELKD